MASYYFVYICYLYISNTISKIASIVLSVRLILYMKRVNNYSV